MKKIFNIVLSLAVAMMTMTSCDEWLDINTSPDNPVTVTCEVVLPTVLYLSAQQQFDNGEYGAYLSMSITTTGKTPSADYAYRAGWGGFLQMNRHPHWRRHFYDIGVNVQYMMDDAEKNSKRNYILICKTVMLNSLLLTTDQFAEMPLYDAYRNNTPYYDTQTTIYDSIARMFDETLAKYNDPEWINCPTNGNINQAMDRMFAGDMDKWRAYTKALYCRFLVRNIPNMNNTAEMRAKIIAAVDDCLSDPGWVRDQMFAAGSAGTAPVYNPGGMVYRFDGGVAEANCMWGPKFSSSATMNLGWPQGRENGLGSAVPGEMLGSILGFYKLGASKLGNALNPNGYEQMMMALDPRASQMMEPRVYNGVKALRSLPNNMGSTVAIANDCDKVTYFPDFFCQTAATKYTNPVTRNDGYVIMISEEELHFIKAEALYWNGQIQDAYNETKEACKLSFQRYGVFAPGANGPTAATMGEAYQEFYALWEDLRLPTPGNGFNIATIMQQKYVSMFLQAEEWNDVRRYNYSSTQNGISYDNTYVYDVPYTHTKNPKNATIRKQDFNETYQLTRPYNIYQPHFGTSKDYGTNFKLSANAWVNRLTPDPETEEKYNKAEMIKWGSYQNPDYLRKRMIWQMPTNDGGAITNSGDGEWMSVDQNTHVGKE